MRVCILIVMSLLVSCAPWKEVKAPCTYDHRKGCGDLIYSNQKSDATGD